MNLESQGKWVFRLTFAFVSEGVNRLLGQNVEHWCAASFRR
jgi:hypothetical protein